MTSASEYPRWTSTAVVVFAVIGVLSVHCLEPAFTYEEHAVSEGHDGLADVLSSVESSFIHSMCDLDAPDVPAAPSLEACGIAGLAGVSEVASSNPLPEADRPANRALLTALSILRL